jgi:hypothetical protein
MRWWIGILAVLTVLVSAGSLYFAYMAGQPSVQGMEGQGHLDAPGMQWILGYLDDMVAGVTGLFLAAILFALVRIPA